MSTTPPMDYVAFDAAGNAFAIGDALPDVAQHFATLPSTVRIEKVTREQACRLHGAYLATLPEFEGLFPTPEAQP